MGTLSKPQHPEVPPSSLTLLSTAFPFPPSPSLQHPPWPGCAWQLRHGGQPRRRGCGASGTAAHGTEGTQPRAHTPQSWPGTSRGSSARMTGAPAARVEFTWPIGNCHTRLPTIPRQMAMAASNQAMTAHKLKHAGRGDRPCTHNLC
jgi:hypothetical protein